MKNFYMDSKSIRGQIKKIIAENYVDEIEKELGLTILKELLQNANDATAKSVNFGYHSGIKNSKNPLLQLPSLFFINDGEFKKEDLNSIYKIWVNNKGDNPNQIGKFGLGLKSIFSWCEAFFYFSSGLSNLTNVSNSKEENGKFGVLNPWYPSDNEIFGDLNTESKNNPYPQWSEIKECDLEQVSLELGGILNKLPVWLCIWIPLRTKRIEKRPPFKNFYPGDAVEQFIGNFEKKKLKLDISATLPLMSSLEKISFWNNKDLKYTINCEFKIPKIEKDKYKTIPYKNFNTQINNEIIKNYFSYRIEKSEITKNLINDQDFPKNEDGSPEKSFNQGAVSISIVDGKSEQGNSIFDWCVYLPITKQRVENPRTNNTIHIKLHGWFFVDSGRNMIDFGKDDEKLRIEQRWNRAIASNNTLPQVLPLVKNMINSGLKNHFINDIANMLNNTDIYSKSWMKESLCSKYCLYKRVYLDHTSWEIHDNKTKYFIIPDFTIKSIDNRIVEKILKKNIYVYEREYYGLSNISPSSWSKQMYLKWLDIPFTSILENNEFVNLWLAVLSNGREKNQKELISCTKTIMRELNSKDLEEHSETIQELLRLIYSDYKIVLDLPNDFPKKYYIQLLNIEIEPLILIKNSNLGLEIGGALSFNDCHKIINEITIKDNERFSKIIIALLEVVNEQVRDQIFYHNRDLKLFLIYNEKMVRNMVSWSDLRMLVENDSLFSTENSSLELYKNFTQILSNYRIGKLINYKQNQILRLNTITCSIDNVLEIIAKQRPILDIKISKKINLLSYINKAELNYKKNLAIRYILHGNKEEFDYHDKLFIQSNDVWSRFLYSILKLTNKEWVVINEKLISKINQDTLKRLNIHTITQNGVENFIETFSNLANLDFLTLNKKDRRHIIADFKKTTLLRNIPIFETISGKLVPIDKNTYVISDDIDIPRQIKQDITFLKEDHILIERRICSKISSNELLDIALEGYGDRFEVGFIIKTMLKVSNISDQLRTKLRNKKWLPLKNQEFGSLAMFIHIEGLENIISEINNGELIDVKMLSDMVSDNKVWEKIHSLKLINDYEQSLRIIKRILLNNPENYLGKIAHNFTNLDYEFYLTIFDSANRIFPITRILEKIKSSDEGNYFYNYFIPDFFRGVPNKVKLISIFNYLYDKSISSGTREKDKIMKLYYQYLELIKDDSNNLEILEVIFLKNQLNEWCLAKSLCYSIPDISKKYLLDERTANILDSIIHKTTEVKEAKTGEASTCSVSNYFEGLAKRTTNDLVGLFLCCFNNDKYLNLAHSRFLTNGRTVAEVRKLLIEALSEDYNDKYWDLDKALNDKSCEIKIQSKNDEYIVSSIINKPLRISKANYTIQESLHIPLYNKNILLLKDFSDITDEKSILAGFYNTFIDYLNNLFIGQSFLVEPKKDIGAGRYAPISYPFPNLKMKRNIQLEKLWKKYSDADQSTIELIQKQIVEYLIPILQGLRVNNEDVNALFAKNDRRIRYELDGGLKDLPVLKKELVDYSRRIFQDENFRNDIFIAVNDKLKTYQYDIKSVLFELFQNADDAVTELIEMGLKPKINQFKVEYNESNLAIMHWGRLINQERGGNLKVEVSRQRRYNDDIVKMLIIGYSRKGEHQTGKYGLGFKSIYSICKTPKIISGSLSFMISGATYPLTLDDDDYNNIVDKLSYPQSGTIIDMELISGIKINDILDDFQKYVYILTCFSNKINQIVINDSNYSSNEYKLTGVESLYKVNVSKESYGLLFKSDAGSILFKLDSLGFCEFSHDIYSIWVTVPTREKDTLGFLINSSFDIDVGRTQLTSDTNINFDISRKIGRLFYSQLNELYEKTITDFAGLKKELSVNTDFYGFWESLFKVLCFNVKQNTENKSGEIAYQILWRDNRSGYYGFLNKNAATPNGLKGKYRSLVVLSNLKYKITGVLSEKLDLLNSVLSIPDNHKFQNVISKAIIDKLYNKLPNYENKKIEELKLIYFLKEILDNQENVNYDLANSLGEIFSEDLYKDMSDKEKLELKEYLKNLKFKSRSLQYTQSRKILILDKKERKEEYRRGSFAQDSHNLDSRYNSNGIRFLIFCRGELGFFADANTLNKWALHADNVSKRVAVLEYLITGDLGQELANKLRFNPDNSNWLKKLKEDNSNSELLNSFDSYEKTKILVQLGFYQNIIFDNESEEEESLSDFKEIDWNSLHSNWVERKNSIIQSYENKIYPYFFNSNNLEGDENDINVRKTWMILFILGITHTFGFDNHYSNKKFIENLERMGTLTFIANYGVSDKKETEKWIEKYIDPFIDSEVGQEQYKIWMKSFSGIYKISRHLSVYIRRFNDGLKFPGRNLAKILSPRIDFEGYVDVPPIKSTLNMGANFVLRELVRFRKGEIENKEIYEDCFVPHKRIRVSCGLDEKMGEFSHSAYIYKLIKKKLGEKKATFDFCFDIAVNDYLK